MKTPRTVEEDILETLLDAVTSHADGCTHRTALAVGRVRQIERHKARTRLNALLGRSIDFRSMLRDRDRQAEVLDLLKMVYPEGGRHD